MKIGLFIPCYVDALYPHVGVATYKLLKSLGLDVEYPLGQTCCGQPMANAGFESMAEGLAEKMDALFAGFDHVVAPSASCAAFVKLNYPHVLKGKRENIPAYSKVKDLLSLVGGITVREPERVDECCGFGGMFSVEEPEVSVRMGRDKVMRHIATGAEYVTGPDSSCLMHMQGIARREGLPIKFVHVVEILSAGL